MDFNNFFLKNYSWIDRQLTWILVRKLRDDEEELVATMAKQRKTSPTEPPVGVNMNRLNTAHMRTGIKKDKDKEETPIEDLGNRLAASVNMNMHESHRMRAGHFDPL